jgi:elongation factor P
MRLKNLIEGNTVDRQFDGEEKMDDVILDRSKFEFLYEASGQYYFMDNTSYEQIEISEENI